MLSQLWIGDILARYCTLLGGNLVTWKSRKQCGSEIQCRSKVQGNGTRDL